MLTFEVTLTSSLDGYYAKTPGTVTLKLTLEAFTFDGAEEQAQAWLEYKYDLRPMSIISIARVYAEV